MTTTRKEPHCPNCGAVINPGALLGMMNLGIRKNYSDEQREAMKAQMARARRKRWPHKQQRSWQDKVA